MVCSELGYLAYLVRMRLVLKLGGVFGNRLKNQHPRGMTIMTKIMRSKDRGNSPKNQLVENLAIALAMSDVRTIADLVADDVQWNIVGGKVFHGRETVLQVLEQMKDDSILVLTVCHVITHGNLAILKIQIIYS